MKYCGKKRMILRKRINKNYEQKIRDLEEELRNKDKIENEKLSNIEKELEIRDNMIEKI